MIGVNGKFTTNQQMLPLFQRVSYSNKFTICCAVITFSGVERLAHKLNWMPCIGVLLFKYTTNCIVTSITNETGGKVWVKDLENR